MKITLLLSGGMDSAVLAAHLARDGHHVEALAIHYGQVHVRELVHASRVAESLDIPLTLVSLPALGALLPSELTTGDGGKVVPNRNAILLSVAVGYAVAHRHDAVALGINRDDARDFYDCRLPMLGHLRRMAEANDVLLLTPFAGLRKAQVAAMASDLELDLDLTRSCYRNGEQPCQQCDACADRARAMGADAVPR